MKKIFILILVLFPVLAQATGVQVVPAKMDFIIETNNSVSKELVVTNPSADVQIFEVYPDEFTEIIKVNPTSFVLEAGAKKNVTITVQAVAAENISQILNTNLSVVGKPLAETRLQANAGVKIPLSIVKKKKAIKTEPDDKISPYLFYPILIAIALVFGSLTYRRKRHKKIALKY